MPTSFESLKETLGDPAKAQTRSQWRSLVDSQLGPEDRQKLNRISPIVSSYLSGEIDRAEYMRQMAALETPQP